MERTEPAAPVQRWLRHINVLAGEIGPRGPATPGESRALDYCSKSLAAAGLSPREDRFMSAGSVFRPHIVAALGIVAAFALYRFAPWPAAALATLVLVSEVLELTLHPNPLQWVLPRKPSGNVFAVLEPAGEVAQDLVLMGHVDTQRTPLIFRSPGWFAAYRAFSTVAFCSFLLMAAGYVIGAATGGLLWRWTWPASGVTAALALLLLAMCVEGDLSPFTAGANDNATGAGLVLTLAGDLQARPLGRTRVWLVCSGSEEALHEGARAFFRTHRAEMRSPRAVVLEMLGCSGPAWVVSEGIVLRVHSDPALRALAAGVAADNPELGAYPAKLEGAVTEMADALAAGVPAITLIGLTPEGKGPYWHLPTDTVDKMDPAAMARNYTYVRAVVDAIDR